MNLELKPKLLVIVGPTASGKSDLAVRIAEWIAAQKICGYSGAEVISADSRQVYRGLDIGTGKITPEEMRGIPHHLLDVADPHDRFTTMDWKTRAEEAVTDIVSRGNLPIICGGTGFYISTLIDNLAFPDVEMDPEEQKLLESRPADELFQELQRLDPARAATIDSMNKRRVVRAIVIARELGAVPPVTRSTTLKYDVLMIGIKPDDLDLRQKIQKRLISRLDTGMIEEAQRLHAPPPEGAGLSYERMDELGLEYRYLARFLKGELDRDGLIGELSAKIWQYAKRQMTWFKRDAQIRWFRPGDLVEIYGTVRAHLGETRR